MANSNSPPKATPLPRLPCRGPAARALTGAPRWIGSEIETSYPFTVRSSFEL
jgi:hypothetical protein